MLYLGDLVFNVATSENILVLSIDFLAIIDYNGSMKNNSPYRHIWQMRQIFKGCMFNIMAKNLNLR